MKYKIPLLLTLMLILAAAVTGVVLPYLGAESTMPEDGVLTVQQQADGGLLLRWPEADRADVYLLEILEPQQTGEPSVLYSDFSACSAGTRIPEMPETELLIRVNSVVTYSVFGMERSRYGTTPLEVTACLDMPEVTKVEWTADPATGAVDLSVQTDGADYWCVYQLGAEGDHSLLQVMAEENWTLQFGEGGLLPVPEGDAHCRLGFAACTEASGLSIQGDITVQVAVSRQDLLGRDLNVAFSRNGDNGFTLTWDETKGEYYEVQRLDGNGDWVSVCRIGREEPRYYASDALPKFREHTYRVVAAGGQTMDGSDYAAVSENVCFSTRESSIYATVWPVTDLDGYFDANRTTVTAAVEAGTAYCVVDERNGMFGVRVDDQICYIDSNYCMINLPEYMGDLCSYRIGNGVSSLYMVHEFEIPDVTGVVTSGYEYVHQADGSDLVPLLYPTAKKLVAAAQKAAAQGYRLRIYDSFRPQMATREIYDLTSRILNKEIPDNTYTGAAVSSLQLPEPEEDGSLTYLKVMTNGQYALNSFLAKGTSRHNLGVALDLTLEELETGNEIPMQTSMHDLSRYSVTTKNNANARTLAAIMKDAGFQTLFTEWWHFQDDEAKDNLSLNALWAGISAEGWTCDDTGWRYRDKRGACYRDQTIRIGESEYTFDENGYWVGGEISFG